DHHHHGLRPAHQTRVVGDLQLMADDLLQNRLGALFEKWHSPRSRQRDRALVDVIDTDVQPLVRKGNGQSQTNVATASYNTNIVLKLPHNCAARAPLPSKAPGKTPLLLSGKRFRLLRTYYIPTEPRFVAQARLLERPLRCLSH